jgi:hypothetical protein
MTLKIWRYFKKSICLDYPSAVLSMYAISHKSKYTSSKLVFIFGLYEVSSSGNNDSSRFRITFSNFFYPREAMELLSISISVTIRNGFSKNVIIPTYFEKESGFSKTAISSSTSFF